jgi:hypothetical protein
MAQRSPCHSMLDFNRTLYKYSVQTLCNELELNGQCYVQQFLHSAMLTDFTI